MKKSHKILLAVVVIIAIVAILLKGIPKNKEKFMAGSSDTVSDGVQLNVNQPAIEIFKNAAIQHLINDPGFTQYIKQTINNALPMTVVNMGGQEVYFILSETVSCGAISLMPEATALTQNQCVTSNGIAIQQQDNYYLRYLLKIDSYCGRARVLVGKGPITDVQYCLSPVYVECIFNFDKKANQFGIAAFDVVDFGTISTADGGNASIFGLLLDNKKAFLDAYADSCVNLTNTAIYGIDRVSSGLFKAFVHEAVIPLLN